MDKQIATILQKGIIILLLMVAYTFQYCSDDIGKAYAILINTESKTIHCHKYKFYLADGSTTTKNIVKVITRDKSYFKNTESYTVITCDRGNEKKEKIESVIDIEYIPSH